MGKLEVVEKEIEDVIAKSPTTTDPAHSGAARKWVFKLKPDADKAMEIAALAHDIDRGYTGKTDVSKEDFSNYEELKIQHSKRSAEIVCKILKKHDFDEKFVERVKHLVECHEFGGDEDCDVLMDADSLAYFEANFEFYFEKFGEDKTRNKIKFMFGRMSEKAKEISRKFEYDNSELNKIFKETIAQI